MSRAYAPTPWSPAEPPAPAAWEWAAVIAVVIMMTGGLIPLLSPDQGVETPALRLIWLPAYAVILGLVIRRARAIAAVWPALLIAGALAGFAFLSSRWSLEPDTTVRRAIALGISMLFAVYLGAVWRGPRLFQMLCIAFLFMGLASLALVAVNPAIGIHQDVNAGMWRGVWYEKNQAGMMMWTAILAALSLLVSGGRGRWLAAATIGVCMVVLLGSQSKTALLCLLVAGGLVLGFHILRKAGPIGGVVLAWLAVVAAGSLVAFFLLSPETLFVLLGKDPTLTGRTEIWDSLLRRSAERPWTGYGYAAFWGKESMAANWVRLETEWDVPSAHHGWLEVLIQLGRIGLVMVGATYVLAVLLGLVRLPTQGVREGYFGIAYLAAFGVLTFSESVVLLHHNFSWVLFTAVLASRFLPQRDAEPVAAPREPIPNGPRRSPRFRSVRPARHTA